MRLARSAGSVQYSAAWPAICPDGIQPSVNHPDLRFGKDWRNCAGKAFWVAMSQFRPDQKRRAPRGLLAVALLGAGAAVFAAPGPALAQETGSLLRGEVSEAEINNDLLSGVPLLERPTPLQAKPPTDNGIPSPTFEPASSGATPDTSDNATPSAGATAAERSIFQSNDGDDVFADELPPAPAGRPDDAPASASPTPARRPVDRRIRPPNGSLRRRRKKPSRDEEDPGDHRHGSRRDRRQRDPKRARRQSACRPRGADRRSGKAAARGRPIQACRHPRRQLHPLAEPRERCHRVVECQFEPGRRVGGALGIDAQAQRHFRPGRRKADAERLRQLPQDDLRRGDRRDAWRRRRVVRARARRRLEGAGIDRLRGRPGIGLGARFHRRHARRADRADFQRQPRRREGRRQIAAQADRQCRARSLRRCRAFDRRHGFPGRPQFDAGFGRAAHRLRDLAGADPFRRGGIWPPLL